MPRQDVPYGGAICRLKERIAEIWDELGKKLHSINGVEGDGQGNVQIVSGDPAVVITDDQVQHEIEISLDTSQLPAAAVSSVNGQTGAVVLDANDIDAGLTPPGTSVAQDLASTKQQVQVIGGLMQQEVLDRQNADSTLQTNINASNGRISVLETEDANNMKLDRSQTASGDNTFTGILKAQGQPAYSPSQPTDDVATIGTLNGYTPMVRTTGLQYISGDKHFLSTLVVEKTGGASTWLKALNIDVTEARTSYQYFPSILWSDKSSVECLRLFPRITPTGRIDLVADVRKPDGTWSFQNLILQGPE